MADPVLRFATRGNEMKLFIDTADVAQIREAWSWGIIDGVTTNPTHIANSGKDFDSVLTEIFSIVDGPISVESVSTKAEGIIEEARRIAAFHRNAVVKVPIMVEGLKAVKVLAREGIKTNVTLCFSPLQAFWPPNAAPPTSAHLFTASISSLTTAAN